MCYSSGHADATAAVAILASSCTAHPCATMAIHGMVCVWALPWGGGGGCKEHPAARCMHTCGMKISAMPALYML